MALRVSEAGREVKLGARGKTALFRFGPPDGLKVICRSERGKGEGPPVDTPAWEPEIEAPASLQLALRDGSRSAAARCIPSQVRDEAGASSRGRVKRVALRASGAGWRGPAGARIHFPRRVEWRQNDNAGLKEDPHFLRPFLRFHANHA